MVSYYSDVAKKYEVVELEHEHETQLETDYGKVFFLKNFPNNTSPFWNMKQNGDGTAAKIDVILGGMETIGSAERSIDIDSFLWNTPERYRHYMMDKIKLSWQTIALEQYLDWDKLTNQFSFK